MGRSREATKAALRGKLTVSCQAFEDNPLFGAENMTTMSRCALKGGAGGLRLCWPQTIRSVRSLCDRPIVGINKVVDQDGFDMYADVFITPTLRSAMEVIEAGCDVVALDGTKRSRPNGERLEDIVAELHERYPDVLVMADLATIEEGVACAEIGFDIVASTLSGYTQETRERPMTGPDFSLIAALKKETGLFVNAEGRIWDLAQLDRAWGCGADMVTMGSAITNPMKTTDFLASHMSVPAELGR